MQREPARAKLLMITLLVLIPFCAQAQRKTPLSTLAKTYGCAPDSIQLKKNTGQCLCDDGTKCMFTNVRKVMGCPCENYGVKIREIPCITQSQKFGCGTTDIDCNGELGSCKCPLSGETCIWKKDEATSGCPCDIPLLDEKKTRKVGLKDSPEVHTEL